MRHILNFVYDLKFCHLILEINKFSRKNNFVFVTFHKKPLNEISFHVTLYIQYPSLPPPQKQNKSIFSLIFNIYLKIQENSSICFKPLKLFYTFRPHTFCVYILHFSFLISF